MYFITSEKDIQIGQGLQCLYFYATWMPFHKRIVAMIDKVEQKYKNITFQAVDVDYFINQCKRFEITAVPEVLILKEGKEIKRISGLVMTSAFKNTFNDIYNDISGEYYGKEKE